MYLMLLGDNAISHYKKNYQLSDAFQVIVKALEG